MATSRRLGIVIVLVSAVMWSTAGLFVRMAGLDIWAMVFWRSLFTALTMFGWMALRPRPGGTANAPPEPAQDFGVAGWISTLIATVAATTYVMALSWTTVANVMTIYAALPIVAGLLGWLWLRDRLPLRFWIAGAVAAAGVALMMGAGFAPRDWLGIAAAVLMTVCFATQLVIARRYPRLDTPRMIGLSALACMLIALPLHPAELPSARALLACALYGGISTGLGYILVLIGGRMIGAGEAAFLSLLDVVLGPVWVWLVFSERAGTSTLLGGGVVLLAVGWYLAGAGGRPRKCAPPQAFMATTQDGSRPKNSRT